MERVPLKQTDRHHKSPGGDLCIRDSLIGGRIHYAYILSDIVKVFGNDSNLLIVFYVQIMPDDFVMQLHRF